MLKTKKYGDYSFECPHIKNNKIEIMLINAF